jgi:GntR family transcriptional regulator / MocR family aminotransferase
VESNWSSGLDLLLDPGRGRGLRASIERSLREAIHDGRLTLGTALPSSRALSRDLGVARGTVSAAYDQLATEGYLEVRQGAPVRVRWHMRRRVPAAYPAPQAAGPRWDFRPGRPDSASFPRQAWAQAHRQVVSHAPDEAFGYGDPCGSTQLRQALAGYLGRTRGVDTDPERLLICNGFTQALTLICRVLRTAGLTRLAVEDPSAPRYRQLAEAAGLTVVPVPCDRGGLRTDQLAASGAQAALVTPAHQYPLGSTMTAARRIALVEWARRHQALIIEDDYDGEFRYDRQPVGALQHLDPDHVIYVGTASKSLAPGLRLGWLSPPNALTTTLAAAKDHLDRGTSTLDQLTFAELITTGAFDRHIRRMRTHYRRRRDELAHTLASAHPAIRLAGISAGLHATIYLPEHQLSEQQIQTRAARASIALHLLGSYWHTPPQRRPQAIIVGYGTPASHAYQPALQELTKLLMTLQWHQHSRLPPLHG